MRDFTEITFLDVIVYLVVVIYLAIFAGLASFAAVTAGRWLWRKPIIPRILVLLWDQKEERSDHGGDHPRDA